MHIIRKLDALPASARGGAVSIGNFDGVHRGHVAIVKQLLERAKEAGGPAIVFTFDPHPVRLLRPDQCPPPLTWTERKAELLAAQGVDWIVAYPTDEALLQLSAAEFFDHIVRDALDARALVEGPNFYFGHNREGTVERLAEMATTAGISLDVVPPVEIGGQIVSSSRVRELIRAGQVEQADNFFRPRTGFAAWSHTARAAGRRSAFPPRISAQSIRCCRPWASTRESDGPRCDLSGSHQSRPQPDVRRRDDSRRSASHRLAEPLYGEPLEVDFLARLRDIRPFDSPAALVEQLHHDVEQVKCIAN